MINEKDDNIYNVYSYATSFILNILVYVFNFFLKNNILLTLKESILRTRVLNYTLNHPSEKTFICTTTLKKY